MVSNMLTYAADLFWWHPNIWKTFPIWNWNGEKWESYTWFYKTAEGYFSKILAQAQNYCSNVKKEKKEKICKYAAFV